MKANGQPASSVRVELIAPQPIAAELSDPAAMALMQ
jgi:hypothetical protein